MKISCEYSHLNGKEWLQIHHPALWYEIVDTISDVDAGVCKTKVSNEASMMGEMKYSPTDMNDAIRKGFTSKGWKELKFAYWVTDNAEITRDIIALPAAEQKTRIRDAGSTPIRSKHQIDFVKNRVAMEVQFGKYAFIEFDLFVKHLGFFLRSEIDLGIEIVPAKALQAQMSSGPGYFERTLTHILRQGRASPSVPFVLLGIEP